MNQPDAQAIDLFGIPSDAGASCRGSGMGPEALRVARDGGALVRQNFARAIGYNVIPVPIAVAGYATPLIAPVAMSLTSVLVVANAMRLGRIGLVERATTSPAIGRVGELAS